MESAARRLTVLGFTGKAGSGKDHMARMLWRTHGFMPIAFADCMKEQLSAREGIHIGEMLKGDKSEEVRTRLQVFGTEENRDVDHDIWVRHAEARLWVLAEKLNHHRFAFTDIRFQNEADLVHKYGGFLVWLRGRTRFLSEEQQSHRSENYDPIECDLVVDNSMGRSALAEEEVRRFVMSWVASEPQEA